jgi:hypothetical protein
LKVARPLATVSSHRRGDQATKQVEKRGNP